MENINLFPNEILNDEDIIEVLREHLILSGANEASVNRLHTPRRLLKEILEQRGIIWD